MNYVGNLDVSEEIDGCKTDPLTGNILGAAIDVHRGLLSYLRLYGTCT